MPTQNRPLRPFLICILPVLLMISCSMLNPTRTVRVEGFSMEPALHDGQIVTAAPVDLSEMRRGDLVLYEHDTSTYLKRLIGLPGESIAIHDGQVFINGAALEEPYISKPAAYEQPLITLGADEYYVLGDNRNNSADSHAYGPISGESIKGRVIP